MKYNTINRNYFLQTIQSFHKPFTAKEIMDRLKENENPMGSSTVYRFLDEFSSDGTIRKIVGEDNTTKYFYFKPCTDENHFYLECEKCHRMTHIDCRHLKNFAKHLSKKHDFKVSNYSLVITGVCASCAEEK